MRSCSLLSLFAILPDVGRLIYQIISEVVHYEVINHGASTCGALRTDAQLLDKLLQYVASLLQIASKGSIIMPKPISEFLLYQSVFP